MFIRKRVISFDFGFFCLQIGKGRVDKYFTCVKFGVDKRREYFGVFDNFMSYLPWPCSVLGS